MVLVLEGEQLCSQNLLFNLGVFRQQEVRPPPPLVVLWSGGRGASTTGQLDSRSQFATTSPSPRFGLMSGLLVGGKISDGIPMLGPNKSVAYHTDVVFSSKNLNSLLSLLSFNALCLVVGFHWKLHSSRGSQITMSWAHKENFVNHEPREKVWVKFKSLLLIFLKCIPTCMDFRCSTCIKWR